MKLLKNVILIFLSFIIGYHVFHTLFLYGFDAGTSFLVSAFKDIVWVLLISSFWFVGRKYFLLFIKEWKWSLLALLFLIMWSIVLSRNQEVSLKMILVGLKYDVYPLIILLSGILIGVEMSQGQGKAVRKKILRYVYYMIVFIVVGGVFWQIGKTLFPDFFYGLGYGSIGDYILGMRPPLYYRTGPGGIMRLQGLFSGPNNYGYFLVSFFSFIVSFTYGILGSVEKKNWGGKKVILSNLFFMLYLFSCFWTLSRGVLVGIVLQIILLVWFFKKSRRKKLFRVGIFAFLLMLGLSLWKWGSTVLHFQLWMDGIESFLQNIWGYGLGSAGPAVHYDGVYLPENHYLQLLLDIGVPGLFLWFAILVSIGYKLRGKMSQVNTRKDSKEMFIEEWFVILLFFGFFGLLVEGLFLHVLEDSMVNYLFLVVFGILIGYVEKVAIDVNGEI